MTVKLREMAVSVDASETRVAVLEDRVLVELYTQRTHERSVVGNVYLGKVRDVLPGMEAAFVDIGLKKNAFLFVDEVSIPEMEVDDAEKAAKPDDEPTAPRRIQEMLTPGQTILVQVTKDPMGTKGARVTTNITLAGRFLVLMPSSEFVGISRRIEGDERERLHDVCEGIRPKGMGLIVRTAAEGAASDELKKDLVYLTRVWKKIQRATKNATPTAAVYIELDLALRSVRDEFSPRFSRLVVDDKPTHEKVVAFLESAQPDLLRRVILHKEKTPLFDKYSINEQAEAALGRKVWLRSGGYITIDKTEALTAIDVNTGKYIGKKSLEDTITKTNLEAAAEIVRQLRLRDIGGIIVLDFIDMNGEENRQRVYDALMEALAEDRTKSRVVEISQLGLIEMTRKNVTDGLIEVLTEPCPTCSGSGRIVSDDTLRIGAERKIVRICRAHRSKAFLFATDPKTLDLLLEPGNDRLASMRQATDKFISLVADPACKPGEVRMIIEGKVPMIEKHLSDARGA